MIKHIKDESFEKEVINKKGVYLVDFYANWCGPCMMLSPILEEIGNSRAGYNILKMDIDENPRVASDLRIDTIPAICIYKDGILVDKKIGFREKDEILDLLEKYKD
ncbi:MAG: thioredoxin [Clostridia bacterium]|nr:thioredoxin [Clostridia bacterium]